MNSGGGPRLGVDAATWSRLSPLLDEALELAPEQRAAWLARLPAAATDLRAALQRLLDPAAPRLNSPPAIEAPAHRPGDAIGPYRLLSLLGEGGMGEVWLAERADGQLTRQVALKLPHAEVLQPGLAARMARERDILAALEHPGIARLYDAGIDAAGRPFLALEHVRGERIDVWCERHRLGVPARLQLFLQTARAVAYAHAQLIVHRDLKPSNLLVDETGQVRLLDFGIARLLGDELAAGELTSRGAAAMTPAFASPEQVGGLPVGTASDIYSLGVLLFELLTGTSPYRPARDTRSALEEAVVSEAPRRPSDAAAERGRRTALRGDLDAIVLHALAKVPAQRYPTVEAFIDDIERHLQHQPVRARPAGVAYVWRKFVRRHRVGVAALAAVALAVVAGSALALWQAKRADTERLRAEQVKDFVAGILRDASPYVAGDVGKLSAVDLMRQAHRRLQEAAIAQPEVRVELGTLIGESLVSLGDYDRAEPVLAEATRQGRSELGDDHVLTLQAWLNQAQMERLRGRIAEQQTQLQTLMPHVRALAGRQPALLVQGLQHMTMNAIDRGAYAEAETFAAEGFAFARGHLDARHPDTVASAVMLAFAHRYAQHFDAARDQAALALQLAQALYPGPTLHPRVMEARAIYGRALADTGRLVDGVAQLQRAADDAAVLYGADSPTVGTMRQNLVAYQIDLGELASAEANGRDALRLVRLSTEPDSYPQIATAASLAQALVESGRHAEALPLLQNAWPQLQRLIGAGQDATQRTGVMLARALIGSGRLADAQSVLASLAPAPGSRAAAQRDRVRAQLSLAQGDAAGAAAQLQALLAGADPDPRLQRERAQARAEAGLALRAAGQPEAALRQLEQALAELARLQTGQTPLALAASAARAELR